MRVRTLLGTAAVAAALALAGCSSGDPAASPTPTTNGIEELTAEQIMDKAQEALDEAGSFRLVGESTMEGQPGDLDIAVSGDDKQGTITTEGVSMELVIVDGEAYVTAEAAFWTDFVFGNEDLLDQLEGKPVRFELGSIFSAMLDAVLEPAVTPTKGDVTEVDGTPAIVLEYPDSLATEHGQLYVSLVGEPYPLRYVDDTITMDFEDIGEPVTIEAPDPAQIVDFNEIAG
jgi:hypothetical protein